MKNQEISDEQISELLKTKKGKRVNSRTKGNAFERKVSKILNDHFQTTEFCRSPGSGAFATTHKLPEHLQVGGDLLTPKDFPYIIECKKGYNFKIADLFNPNSEFLKIVDKLSKEATKYKKKPLLVFQQDRASILCLVAQVDLDNILYTNIKDGYTIGCFINKTVRTTKHYILEIEHLLTLLT
jgi:hypothetical protein